jgi:hypothetical protein
MHVRKIHPGLKLQPLNKPFRTYVSKTSQKNVTKHKIYGRYCTKIYRCSGTYLYKLWFFERKVKVEVFLSTSYRHIGEVEVQLYSFLTSAGYAVDFTALRFYPRGKNHRHPLEG